MSELNGAKAMQNAPEMITNRSGQFLVDICLGDVRSQHCGFGNAASSVKSKVSIDLFPPKSPEIS